MIYYGLVYFLGLITMVSNAYNHSLLLENYPAPFTPHNRVIGFVLSFNLYHIEPVILILNEYVSMCEAGWDPTLIFFTTIHWSDTLLRYMKAKTYCYRKGDSIVVKSSEHNATIGIALGAEHRRYLGNVVNDYDVFIYHEDDIVFKLSHLHAYLYETKKLHTLLPEGGLWDNCIGFQRYRRIPRGNDIHQQFGDQDLFEQELLEEMPDFHPICIKDDPYLKVGGNIHQAMWVLTQQQVNMLQEKCSFLNQSSASREYMSSFSLFDHKRYHCGLNKILPADRLYTFGVLHYYQQRHIQWTPVFFADENIRAGYHYHAVPRTPMGTPPCWEKLVSRYRADQAPKNETTALKRK